MITRFFKWLFGAGALNHPSPHVETTKEFQAFEKWYRLEDVMEDIQRCTEDYQVQYICQYGLSPFEHDDDLEKARSFLIRHGVTQKII